MGALMSRDTLMTVASAIVIVAVVAFLLAPSAAAGKTRTAPVVIGEAAFIDIGTPAAVAIGTPIAIEQSVELHDEAKAPMFRVAISNDSPVEAIILRTLSDPELGDLNGRGDCAVPQVIPAGEVYRCSFPQLEG